MYIASHSTWNYVLLNMCAVCCATRLIIYCTLLFHYITVLPYIIIRVLVLAVQSEFSVLVVLAVMIAAAVVRRKQIRASQLHSTSAEYQELTILMPFGIPL